MMSTCTYTLIHSLSGNMVFKVVALGDTESQEAIQRLNHYSMILITEGGGTVQADFAEYSFSGNTLLCFAPYQPFRIVAPGIKGFVVNFHPDFFCIYRHHKDVGCHGVLFNNIYRPPFHALEGAVYEKLLSIIGDMRQELEAEALGQHELLASLLRIFLITATRSKAALPELPGLGDRGEEGKVEDGKRAEEPFVMQKLKNAIEEHYRQKHSAGEYASLLHISPKALARITKHHFNRTLTNMIAERIVIEAKRELYISGKAVKEIAYELGFTDEYHFSRWFKNKAAISPQVYRNQVGFAKEE
jgi:AraC family transcriptional regulator, transcriptional activator of pobA